MQTQLDLINNAINLSEQLLNLAKSGDWQQFDEVEKLRQASIEKLNLQTVNLPEKQQQQVQQKMLSLLDLNKNLEEICREQRHTVAIELKKFQKGSQAKKAYSE